MSVGNDLREMFDTMRCTGLTIWVDHDNHIQCNTRGPDGLSWNCHTDPDFLQAVNKATESYLKVNKISRVRVPKRKIPKRDLSDLI